DPARRDPWSNGDDLPNGLVSKDAREWSRQLTVGLMHVREAQATGTDRDQHLVRTRIRCGNLFDFPSAFYGWNDSSFHSFSMAGGCRRGQFWKYLSVPFYSYNRPGAKKPRAWI